jgi:hypothetical protein
MKNIDFLFTLYQAKQTVFRLSDIVMLMPTVEPQNLSERMGYYVETGRLIKLRKGLYAKPNYDPLELANRLFAPAYISLEYVLQRAGVLFQYDESITCISYLSRELEIDGRMYRYRKIKPELIMHPRGLLRQGAHTMATPERAFLDLMYLNTTHYFDNLQPLNRSEIMQLLPTYQNKKLEDRVVKLLGHDR